MPVDSQSRVRIQFEHNFFFNLTDKLRDASPLWRFQFCSKTFCCHPRTNNAKLALQYNGPETNELIVGVMEKKHLTDERCSLRPGIRFSELGQLPISVPLGG